MAIIYISIKEFEKQFIKRNWATAIFESKDRILAVLASGVQVMAFKKTEERLAKESIPFTAIGYPSIATVDCKRLDVDLAAEIHEDFERLPAEEQTKILQELGKKE